SPAPRARTGRTASGRSRRRDPLHENRAAGRPGSCRVTGRAPRFSKGAGKGERCACRENPSLTHEAPSGRGPERDDKIDACPFFLAVAAISVFPGLERRPRLTQRSQPKTTSNTRITIALLIQTIVHQTTILIAQLAT